MNQVLSESETMDLPDLMMKSHCKGFTPLDRRSKLDEVRHLTGFTLVEVLVAAAILAFCLCGLLATYINMFFLADLSRDFTLTNNAIQAKIEEIKRIDFTQLTQDKTGPFNLTDYGLPIAESKGRLEVEENFGGYTSNLTKIRLIASFKSRGRIIGEDSNLNGILNSGEDTNNNGRLDSPIEVITLIAK